MRSHLVALTALVALATTACDPTCAQTCRKLLDCEGVGHVGTIQDECEINCQQQDELYKYWDDEELQEEHAEARSCIVDKSCGQIEDGACYDEDLFVF